MDNKYYLDKAYEYARDNSTCIKVSVGSLFVDNYGDWILGCNRNKEYSCKSIGECYKKKVTGIYESTEETRYACKSTHSEIEVIGIMKENNIDPSNGTLYVTRYPCINCARAIAEYGFRKVVYGGIAKISDEVAKVFDDNHIIYEHCPECDYEY